MSSSKGEITQFRECFLLRDHEIIKEDLWIRDGKIVNPEPIFYVENEHADIQVDCGGRLIAPGFIDLQINGNNCSVFAHYLEFKLVSGVVWAIMIPFQIYLGGFGVDFSCATRSNVQEGVQKVARGLLPHGVTSFCPTLITSPVEFYKEVSKVHR